jgi:hypothetical protein
MNFVFDSLHHNQVIVVALALLVLTVLLVRFYWRYFLRVTLFLFFGAGVRILEWLVSPEGVAPAWDAIVDEDFFESAYPRSRRHVFRKYAVALPASLRRSYNRRSGQSLIRTYSVNT